MNIAQELQKLRDKEFFTTADVADVLGIKPESAWVTCSRYVKNGLFLRLKNNFYVLSESWRNISREGLLKTANYLQVPSYISFMTALSYYEVTTQVQRDFVESAATRRSVKFNVKETEFDFYKLDRRYYFGYERKRGFFIASKEKALVDAAYLSSLGKYSIDKASLDTGKLNAGEIRRILKAFPDRTSDMTAKICGIL